MRPRHLVIIGLLALVARASASEPAEVETIRNSLKKILPGVHVTRIEESSIPGLYSALIGAEVLYVSKDGRFLLKGDLIDIANLTNLSEQQRSVARRELLVQVPEDEFIDFAPDNPRHTIYVFTDVTCGYCQKLQSEIADINRNGIAVRYLAFPRAGGDSDTSRRMEAVWCAKDRRQALTDAMIGLEVKSGACPNPVEEHFALGEALGIRGTPAIYTEDGRYLPGYFPPDKLLEAVSGK